MIEWELEWWRKPGAVIVLQLLDGFQKAGISRALRSLKITSDKNNVGEAKKAKSMAKSTAKSRRSQGKAQGEVEDKNSSRF